MNVIDQYCKGKEGRFQGKDCAFYLPPDECDLLKTKLTLQMIFDKGRCQPFELVKHIVTGQLKKILDKQEYENIVTFQKYNDDIVADVTDRIMQERLNAGAKLPILITFIERVSINAIISKRRQYRKEQKRFVRLVTKSGKDDQLAKNELDEAAFAADMQMIPSDSEQSLLDNMLQALGERIEQEADSKKRFLYKRQEQLFFKLLHLRDQGYSKKDAIEELATQFHCSTRTIRRDLEELEQYLRS